MISSLPHPTGAEKGVEVQRRLFISVLLHNCATAEFLPLPTGSSPREAGKETGKRYVTCSGLCSKPMAEVGGELAGPGRAPAEPERLHIPAIPCTYFSRGEAAASQADHPTQHTTCFLIIPLPFSVHRHTLQLFPAFISREFKISGDHAHRAQHIH